MAEHGQNVVPVDWGNHRVRYARPAPGCLARPRRETAGCAGRWSPWRKRRDRKASSTTDRPKTARSARRRSAVNSRWSTLGAALDSGCRSRRARSEASRIFVLHLLFQQSGEILIAGATRHGCPLVRPLQAQIARLAIASVSPRIVRDGRLVSQPQTKSEITPTTRGSGFRSGRRSFPAVTINTAYAACALGVCPSIAFRR